MNNMSNLVKWGSYDEDAMEAEEEFASRIVGDYIKMAEGNNLVRILPPAAGRRTPWVLVQEHHIDIGDSHFRFVCPTQMANQPCPMCGKAKALKESGNQADYNAARKLFPTFRAYANAIDYRVQDLGPRILGIGKKIHKDLRMYLRQNGDYTNPETGYALNIIRTGSGIENTQYQVIAKPPSKLENFDWIEAQHNLLGLTLIMPYEDILAELRGEDRSKGKRSNIVQMPRAQQQQVQQQQVQKPQAPQRRPKTVDADLDTPVGEEDDFPAEW